MTTKTTSPEVAATLERIRSGEPVDELYFDPATGQLVVRQPEATGDIDSRPATVMAREGFFAMTAVR